MPPLQRHGYSHGYGLPCFGQIVKATSHAELTYNARGEAAQGVPNALLVLTSALVAEAESRALGCPT